MTMEYQQLEIDAKVIGEVQGGCYAVFQMHVESNRKMLKVIVKPLDDLSDPDLYIAYEDPEVGQERYTWKSNCIGANSVEMQPNDSRFQPGTYYIAIYGFKPGTNKFKLCTKSAPTELIIPLSHTWTGELKNKEFFSCKVEHPGDSRLEITIDQGLGNVILYISSSFTYPNEKEHMWSMGNSEWDEYMRQNDWNMFDVDPFQDKMPMNYTRRPTPSERYQLTNNPPSASYTKNDPLRLCIDTDTWKYANKTCYISVKNLNPEPFNLTISKREVLEEDLMDTDIREKYLWYKSIFDQIDGGGISNNDREKLGVLQSSEFTYGEIEFIHMLQVLQSCQISPGQVFWDLGSGAGKCLLTVALFFPDVRQVKGIEYLPELCQASKQLLEGIQSPYPLAEIQVLEGDILREDWSDADVIYMSSICFPDELIEGIYEKALALKDGAIIATLKPFPENSAFEVIQVVTVKMTWGKTEVYILRKLSK